MSPRPCHSGSVNMSIVLPTTTRFPSITKILGARANEATIRSPSRAEWTIALPAGFCSYIQR